MGFNINIVELNPWAHVQHTAKWLLMLFQFVLGSEYVKKIEVYFCELCRIYLPRLDQPERALSIHCRTRTHLQRYVRYRDDRALRSKAEKIHHRKEVAKENAVKEAEAKKSLEEKTEGEDEVRLFLNILEMLDPFLSLQNTSRSHSVMSSC
jgi:hypothetical protein